LSLELNALARLDVYVSWNQGIRLVLAFIQQTQTVFSGLGATANTATVVKSEKQGSCTSSRASANGSARG